MMQGKATGPGRAWIAAAAVAVHICLGSVYAWSVFLPALAREAGWTKAQATWAFSLAIATLGFTAALATPLTRRLGPRRAVALSAGLFGLGVAGAGLAVHLRALPLLYLSYGLVGGMGLGLGYVPPVTTLMGWFADRKGLATGLAVGGFGLGALLGSFAAEALLKRFGCAPAFVILGLVYACGIFLASRLLRLPDDGNPTAEVPARTGVLGEPRFWLLWTLFFLNIATGILLIALARPMLEEAGAGRAALPAVTAVALMGLFNGLGRFGWASLSDRVRRLRIWGLMFILQGLTFLLLRAVGSPLALAVGLWVIASCYGGGFALCPALVADLFGPDRGPKAYGLALTAWSAAALLSPPIAAQLREITGSYTVILGLCALASLAGLGLVALLARASYGAALREGALRP